MEQQQQQAGVGWCIKRGTALAAGPGIMDPESSSLVIGKHQPGTEQPRVCAINLGSPSLNLPVFVSRAFIIRTGARGDMSYHPLGIGLLHGFSSIDRRFLLLLLNLGYVW